MMFGFFACAAARESICGSIAAVVTGYMGFLDLGVRASTGRHVILYLGRDDHQSVVHETEIF